MGTCPDAVYREGRGTFPCSHWLRRIASLIDARTISTVALLIGKLIVSGQLPSGA